MDFLKLLRSFEELLFEVLTWLIYYPRTLWLVLRNPLAMMRYSDHEQGDDDTDRYADTLSPPFLLLLTVVLAHGLELADSLPQAPAKTDAMELLFESDQNLIVARSLLFGLLPLMAAIRFAKARGLPLERRYLRGPFFGQCYLAAPFALAISAAIVLSEASLPATGWISALTALAATLWYLAIQTAHFRQAVPTSLMRALGLAISAFGSALAYVLAVGFILARGV